MKQRYYECHITMQGSPKDIKPIIDGMKGWKFSAIDGDIIMGNGVLCYATAHFNYLKFTEEQVIGIMNSIAEDIAEQDINVIRQKVELVIYDTKKG